MGGKNGELGLRCSPLELPLSNKAKRLSQSSGINRYTVHSLYRVT